MGTYLNKAIPDTKLTIRKYADTKFEYLSYCLKVKEMDDEEYGYNALQEPLYRVETGNYEYRLILRCRQEARTRFARLRSDVMVKLELLDNKKTQDVAYQLKRFIQGLAVYHNQTVEHLKENSTLFPVEVDLSQNAFQYKSTAQILQDNQDDEDLEYGKEIQEYHDASDEEKLGNVNNRRQTKDNDADSSEQLLPDLTVSTFDSDVKNETDNLSLLTELGLVDTDTQPVVFGDFQNGLNDFMQKESDNDDVFDKLLNDLNIGK
ncbi:PRKCA-binding protein [Papilio machaon]|uniref:PRKCA-binding protein n=1 Tax=Papilio machaon TaxID=76193 RepID=A0A0N1PHB2_PAPMA|nr:PRKCA-binding protein [Papilio machaon]